MLATNFFEMKYSAIFYRQRRKIPPNFEAL